MTTARKSRQELLIDLCWMAMLSLVLLLFISTVQAQEPTFETFAPAVSPKMQILLTAAATPEIVAEDQPTFQTFLPAEVDQVSFQTFAPPGPASKAEYLAGGKASRVLLFTGAGSPDCESAKLSAVPWLNKSQWQVDVIDIEAQKEIAEHFAIKSVPTFVVVLGHEERSRTTGFETAREAQAKHRLSEAIRAAQRSTSTAALR
ncbi:thioredoxin family protein [Planctomicrobium sp. SH661]|uniref:thioredoxin family protein n=1 Tax=Planctomicrobium sp. SH661 TaxID=3448124 RepID=UPI003F5C9EA0